jgi:hypothetical protein
LVEGAGIVGITEEYSVAAQGLIELTTFRIGNSFAPLDPADTAPSRKSRISSNLPA